MEEIKKKELYKRLISSWGEDAQIRMCIEEMSELTKELCKYLRYKDFEKDKVEEVKKNIIEETADVLNCVEQMKLMFGENEVDEIIDYKLNRVEKRLESFNKNNK